MSFIPYGRQDITEEDLKAVIDVLNSDWITQGPTIDKFEKSLADYTGVQFVSAMNSATSALHVACLSLGVGKGDLVWTSPITFVASSNCALYCGADIDFVDIDPRTYNMSVMALETKLNDAKKKGRLPKVVIPVHMTGQSCEMKRVHELSKEYGFRIIEDASHAIGGKYLNKPVGNCEFSDITVFSFHPVKIVTTGEGGACLTNQKDLKTKIDLFRSHGVTRDNTLMQGESHGPWYYQQVELGLNYRITDIQAALGLSQMNRLDQYIQRRHDLVQRYNEKLKDLPIELPYQHPDTHNSYHLYIIKMDRLKRKEVFEKMREAQIGVNIHYIPVHTQPYYYRLGFRDGDFPLSEKYYEECLSIPMFPTMTEEQQDFVCEKLAEFLA